MTPRSSISTRMLCSNHFPRQPPKASDAKKNRSKSNTLSESEMFRLHFIVQCPVDDAGGLSACECLLRPLDSHDDLHDQVAFNRGEDKVPDEACQLPLHPNG